MRKTHFLTCILLSLIPQTSFAHTISQHLTELYGETYLPLFIIAKILPFIGLGMLSYNQGSSSIPFRNHWMILIGILCGMILAFVQKELSIFFTVNNVGIIILGLLLIIINKPNKLLIQLLLAISGISLGYAYTINITHTKEFKWLFITLLIIGISIFLALDRIQFFRKGIRDTIRITTGILLFIAGLIVLLLT